MRKPSRFGTTSIASVAVFALALILPVFAAAQTETIDATARGTSTQMGAIGNVKLVISEFSTPEDKQTLVEAFKKGQSQGLYNALEKMKPVGQIQTPGTVGYSLAYVSQEKTATGRIIRFVTNRKIAFGEAYRNTPSQAYDLTAGKIEINDTDAKKSSGTLLPATQLIINKDGQLQWEARKNPWQLTNIIDWNKGKEK
jgi:hypothetical protein